MDELRLVQRMKLGDKTAFDEVYEEYKDVALRMIYLLCHNMADSEDIVQEAFVKCWLHIRDLKSNEGFRPWFFQILYRTAYRYLKKKSREVPREDAALEAELSSGAGTVFASVGAGAEFDRRETARWVMEAVNRLELRQRAVIVLHYYNGFSTKQIAGIVGCTEGTVKSRLFTARKRLKEMLGPTGNEREYNAVKAAE